MNYSSDSLVCARVCEAAQEHFCIRFEDGAECDAAPAGALRWSAEPPAVGDWVRARRADATLALIENVEPRTTCILRQRAGRGGKQIILALALLAAACCELGQAQTPPPPILEIDIANYVPYTYDVFDIQKFATGPVLTPLAPLGGRAFQFFVFIGDIVAVNGKPVKGLWTARGTTFSFEPNAVPGHSTADFTRANIIDMYWEIAQVDGTPIGTLSASGLTRGIPPPGAPLAQTGDNLSIIGGTGAFLGARGQAGVIDLGSPRQASVVEDPAFRRIIGGAKRSYVLHLIPMSVPQIVSTAAGPAVTHSSDFTLVTASKPARPGEILSLFVSGLGATRPGIDPGRPFPSSPLQSVAAPVEVAVNGKSAEVLAAVGLPGATDGYQVNFRLPTDTAKGTAILQVGAAWITGPAVSIVIQ